MDNEKPKRIRTARIAFVQKTMEGATGILVKLITWKIQQGKKLMGLKFTVNESLETIQKLDKTIILENTRQNLQ